MNGHRYSQDFPVVTDDPTISVGAKVLYSKIAVPLNSTGAWGKSVCDEEST